MLNSLSQTQLQWLGAAVLVLIVLLIVGIVWYRRSRHYLKRFDKTLKTHALGCYREIFIPDGVDGHIWVDCLIATDTGIWILDIRDYEGDIFAAENIDEWTQLRQGKSLKFNNPLQQNALRETAANLLIKNIPVRSLVVFGEQSRFPKNRPSGVVMMSELQGVLTNAAYSRLDSNLMNDAWQALENTILENQQQRVA